VKTAGAPARLVATPERGAIASDGEDVGYVTLKVVDRDGNFCPTANIGVKVSVSGCGTFVASENGDETDFTWLRDPSRKTFNGLLSALVRATPGAEGEITIVFEAEGLPPAAAKIKVNNQE
jgi:beta-galactosidase